MKTLLIRAGLSAGLLFLFLLHTGQWLPLRLFDVLEQFTYDARVLMTMPRTVDRRVVIVDIDERSIAAVGQFPWPRQRLAQMVDSLFERYQVRTVGFDIAFAEPDGRSPHRILGNLPPELVAPLPASAASDPRLDYDQAFASSLQGRPVVLGYYFRDYSRPELPPTQGELCPPLLDEGAVRLLNIDFLRPAGYTGNLPVLQGATDRCGYFDIPTIDADGVLRRVPLVQVHEGKAYQSLALAVLRTALGDPPAQFEFDPPEARGALNLERLRLGPLTVPVDGQASVMIPYRGPEGSFPYVSAIDVLQGTADADVLQGAVVLVGTTAPGLRDLRSTPVGAAYSGVEVHANLISGMLDGRVKQKAPYYAGVEAVLLLAVAVMLALAFLLLSPLAVSILTLLLLAGITGLAIWMWQGAQFIMPLGVPLLFTLVVFLAQVLYGYFVEARGKRDIARRFGQYVPPQLVAELAAHPEALSMEGDSREMSVLFSDVRNFTGISERLEARELAELMNRFLTRETAVIQQYRGTIDKYMGDAVMAFWGAPLHDPDHALHAVLAGMEMVRAVRDLDAEFTRRGWPRLEIGVGINSGRMNVGNMGSEFRMAYTVMGDAVNLGSRVEGLTKVYGSRVICTEFTRKLLPSDWAFRELDLVAVKGRQEPVAIYEPLGPKERLDPALREELARHRGALRLYRAQRWDEAEVEFFNLGRATPPHPVYTLFLERIAGLRKNPPGPRWNGVAAFEHK